MVTAVPVVAVVRLPFGSNAYEVDVAPVVAEVSCPDASYAWVVAPFVVSWSALS